MFRKKLNIHFVGIGGSGMSGIAEVLINLGHHVSGSDFNKTEITKHLKTIGAKIYLGHNEKNINSADVVVTSTAVGKDNPEIIAALKKEIPVVPRIEMLAEIARLKYTLTVAGTHGKTTTTSLTSLVLEKGGLDPTIIIGGKLKNFKTNAKLGKGSYIIAEADESDGSFLKLSPIVTVITNIDSDHLDFYGNMKNLKKAFIKHINSVPFYGVAIICSDDKVIKTITNEITKKYITYGITGNPDIKAINIKTLKNYTRFDVIYMGKKTGSIRINIPGKHNVLNSLAAAGVGLWLDISFNSIAKAINDFDGVGRRFEIKGEKNGITVIDDYAHHPTEIIVTLKAIKKKWPNRRIFVLFQPHRYTRTKQLFVEFGKSFFCADFIEILDIYSANEQPIDGVTSGLILKGLLENKCRARKFLGVKKFSKNLSSGDIVLTLGAGDVWEKGEELLNLI
jgi:UDP-N-acetylmuramate--alanine ligase